MKIIIDGYNLINEEPHLKDSLTVSLEIARNHLLTLLQNKYIEKNIEIIVVFDGCDDVWYKNNQSFYNIKVVFSRDSKSADELIREMVESEKNPKNLTVVSSDNQHIGRYSKSFGVKIISSREFGKSLFAKEKKEWTKPEIKSEEELHEWLEYFRKNKK